jgi:diadenylate cyclase
MKAVDAASAATETRMLQNFGHIPQLSVISIIDILVVAFIIYEFLKLIKGTRAIPMLVAVVLLVAAFWLAHVEQLKTVDWLITTLFPYAVFALIVVFGAEIRHALARLGRRLSTSRGGAFNGADSYEDIVLAANHLSQTVTGALIVIEREIGLRTFIESGVPLDANLSYDLLITIFRPSAPLHDGAVIIQKGRIAAAACFLPLSMNPVLSTQFGTRHRAAIGITEETDAISVVVSEETGSISIAVGGAIERDITVEYLRERLSEVLRRYVPPAALPTTVTDREMAAEDRAVERLSHEKDLTDGAER